MDIRDDDYRIGENIAFYLILHQIFKDFKKSLCPYLPEPRFFSRSVPWSDKFLKTYVMPFYSVLKV